MTTENVAILFTDIVGSTELSQRLSPEGADEVRRGHFSILRQAIAEKAGTEVKNLGDGVMAVFGSASAALGCAVAMQQGVEQDNRKSRHPAVGLRIGLSGGEVVPEDDDYLGRLGDRGRPAVCPVRRRADPCFRRRAIDGGSAQPSSNVGRSGR